jgi:nitroreductase
LPFKNTLKEKLQKSPLTWGAYYRTKTEILRIIRLRFYLYDISQNYKAMNWSTAVKTKSIISSELIFQYHKLEKGLVMPGPKRLFGLDPARAVMAIITRWQNIEVIHESDPVYLGAIGTLQSYHDRIILHNLDDKNIILSNVKIFLERHNCQRSTFSTPCKLVSVTKNEAAHVEHFKSLVEARRSVRNFLDTPVPKNVLIDSIKMAQLSPSACNRQPWHVTIVSEPEIKNKLLSHQNGNAGFGHLAPHIAVITADASCFFGVTERNQPFVDGGLFSMSLILALKTNDVSTCCLNWCVTPKTDMAVHKLLKFDESLRIIMLVAIGYAPNDTYVPRSPRRNVDDILSFV